MAKRRDRVSEAVIRRLPKYYRYITELKNNGVQRVSSNELGQKWDLLHPRYARTSIVLVDLVNRVMDIMFRNFTVS